MAPLPSSISAGGSGFPSAACLIAAACSDDPAGLRSPRDAIRAGIDASEVVPGAADVEEVPDPLSVQIPVILEVLEAYAPGRPWPDLACFVAPGQDLVVLRARRLLALSKMKRITARAELPGSNIFFENTRHVWLARAKSPVRGRSSAMRASWIGRRPRSWR